MPTNLRPLRLAPVFAVGLLLGGGGCADSPPSSDAGALCRGSREEVDRSTYQGTGPACPDTYEALTRNPPVCSQSAPTQRTYVATCGSMRVRHTVCGGLRSFYCAYDASGQLAGQIATVDAPLLCGQSSSCIQYGELGDGLACHGGDVSRTCTFSELIPDGG